MLGARFVSRREAAAARDEGPNRNLYAPGTSKGAKQTGHSVKATKGSEPKETEWYRVVVGLIPVEVMAIYAVVGTWDHPPAWSLGIMMAAVVLVVLVLLRNYLRDRPGEGGWGSAWTHIVLASLAVPFWLLAIEAPFIQYFADTGLALLAESEIARLVVVAFFASMATVIYEIVDYLSSRVEPSPSGGQEAGAS